MTAPTPAPTSGTFGGITLTLPKTTTTSTADLYGLGDWGKQNIPVGSLPFPITVGPKGNATGDSILKAFAQSDPGSIAEVQRALYLGGYYSSTYTPTYGVIKPEDLSAFASAVTSAGKQQSPVADVLLAGAQYGTAAGVAAARQQATAQKAETATVSVPNAQDLEAEALTAFQNTLGHKPTPAEAAAFAATYQAMSVGTQRANNQAEYNASNGPGSQGGITASQSDQLQSEIGQSAAPTPFQQHAAAEGPVADNEDVADQPPSFASQLNSLGQIAQTAAQEAVPSGSSAGGLTQVDQQSVEDPSVAATNFARNSDPNQAAAKDTASAFDTFLGLLSQNFGGSS